MNMRPSVSWLIAPVVVLLIAVFTLARGSVFGIRQAPVLLPAEVSGVTEGDGYIEVTIRNNELRMMSVEVAVMLIDPATGATTYDAPLVIAHDLAPNTETVVRVPVPETVDAGAHEIDVSVSEWIAYAGEDAALDFARDAGQTALEDARDLLIQSARLESLGEGLYRLRADLVFDGARLTEARGFRYSLTLTPVGDESALSYRSGFQTVALAPDERVEAAFVDRARLADGAYRLSLWAQIGSAEGGYEHYAQFTFAETLLADG
jgi:hypothetical protein